FGATEITGLRRYHESVVRNLSPFAAGEPYSREKLDTYQRRLTATNRFASVQVTTEADPAHADALPVKVSLIEAPSHKIDIGGGYSTDTQWNVQLDYRNVDFLGTDYRLSSTLAYQTKIQGANATLEAPAGADGWLNLYTGKIQATQIQGLDTVGAAIGF